jgi:carboxyl-terminal processing protease
MSAQAFSGARMKRTRTHPFVAFLAGIVATISVGALVVGSAGWAASRYEDLSLFASVLDLVRRNYVEPVDEHELMESALQGLLRSLDPHSAYMSSEAYEEMQVDTSGEFHGLGIEITKGPGQYILVVSPIEGTPAFRAGLQPKDQITEICPTEIPEDWDEGETCRGTQPMTLIEAVSLMRGRKGTDITIHVYREGFVEPQPFTIRRDVVQMASVVSETVEPGYGHVRIRSFQERTGVELSEALTKLHAENPDGLEGLVLDLRDNPGGLLNQAVIVADTWLSSGLIVYTQGRADGERQEFVARPDGVEPDYPIVVLVNAGSASASEIVAGALQDQGRALVLGHPTFGKGSVQTVFPLEAGAALRLTTALYYTPSGRSIQEVGIDPDIELSVLAAVNEQRRQRIREKDLLGHIAHADAEPGSAIEAAAPTAATEAEEVAEGEEEIERDLVLARAVEVLKSWRYFEGLSKRLPSARAALEGGAASEGAEPAEGS